MDTKIITYSLILLVMVSMMLISIFSRPSSVKAQLLQQNSGSSSITTTVSQSQASSTTTISAILFSSTPYYQYAYQIFPGNMSQMARSAMAGFSMNTTVLANGITNVSISLTGAHQSQTVSVPPGFRLYVIETTFGDDGYNFEGSLGDDGFVLVNLSGYVV